MKIAHKNGKEINLDFLNKRQFQVVSDEFRKNPNVEIQLPQRATKKSACYDFYSPISYLDIQPNQVVKIWTDIKANMNDDNVLLLQIRSSMGGKWELNNVQGIIDSDYYENESNDGNIGIFLKNISNTPQDIIKGDRICQGMFCTYLTTIDDEPISEERNGGFGSTNN